jgi:hypothetical protein
VRPDEIGWILLWALGVPIPLLLIFFSRQMEFWRAIPKLDQEISRFLSVSVIIQSGNGILDFILRLDHAKEIPGRATARSFSGPDAQTSRGRPHREAASARCQEGGTTALVRKQSQEE